MSVDRGEVEKRIQDSYELPNGVLQSVPAPLVSVRTITYQHAAFIGQCIDSVLMQRTSFPFEYIIGEDCSTDGTREIVMEYAKRHPNVIRVITSDRNAGAKANACRTRAACRGKYIAVCEGDDYWTDPYKLQKQVDFLESHPDYAICFHWAQVLDQESGSMAHWRWGPRVVKDYYTVDDLLEYSNFIPTCSVMYRSRLFEAFPDWYYQSGIGDLPLHVLNAQYGKIGFIDEEMGVYRRHRGGLYAGNTPVKNRERLLHTYRLMGEGLSLSGRRSFRIGYAKWSVALSREYAREKRMLPALRAAWTALGIAPLDRKPWVLWQMIPRLGFVGRLKRVASKSVSIVRTQGIAAWTRVVWSRIRALASHREP